MNVKYKYLLAFLILIAFGSLCGCDDEDNPFRRRQVPVENQTPEWRYSHNYRMFWHEHGVMERYLESASKVSVRSSWPRLKEYLLGMKENMPEEMAFDFLVIVDEYDKAINKYIKENKNPRGALSRILAQKDIVRKKYSPKKVYPEGNK